MSFARHFPWNDKVGRFSALRAAAFAAALLPGIWIAWALYSDRLAAEPLKQATHLTGRWTLYFLLATLAVTPLRRLLGWSKLIFIRRMLGLTAFSYILAHFSLYILDQQGDLGKVAHEITHRIYLTIGFTALMTLAALAATSFDAAIRRLKRNWKRLHWAIYPATALGLLHFFMQSKLQVNEPVLLTGIYLALMLHRVAFRLPVTPAPAVSISLIAILAGFGAGALEYCWYEFTTGIPGAKVFLSNFNFSVQVRPMWWAMLICASPLVVVLIQYLAGQWQARMPARLSR